MGLVHDLTGITKLLRHGVGDDLWIVHHQPDVQVGDSVLIGSDWKNSLRYMVLLNEQPRLLIDQWYALIRRRPPDIYVAGFTFSASPTPFVLLK